MEDELADELNEEVKKESVKPTKKPELTEIVLSVAKNRQGPLDYIDYHFYGSYCRFNEQRIFKNFIIKKKKSKKS